MPLVIRENEPLAPHTVFKIGGPARFFVEVMSRDDFVLALSQASQRNLPWFILGSGSNVLVSDQGFDGTVIHWAGGQVEIEGEHITAEAGVPMARVVAEALKAGLRGFEWAMGVPGTIGGSIRGNAGCFGGEMNNVVESVEVFDALMSKIETWPAERAEFGYRTSVFKQRPELVILASRLRLQPGDRPGGEKLVRDFTRHRLESQDIGSRSAGCIFKNIAWTRRDLDPEKLVRRFPELAPFRKNPGIPSGFLIQEAGLKGRRIGGAMVSGRHGNFIINTGAATAEDVVMLIGLIKEYVHRHYGLLLEEEIQYVGF